MQKVQRDRENAGKTVGGEPLQGMFILWSNCLPSLLWKGNNKNEVSDLQTLRHPSRFHIFPMRVSIYRWGGHPVTTTDHSDPSLPADVDVFRQWSRSLIDTAYVCEEWLPWAAAGKVWLEGPSSDSGRRLLLRAFYERAEGERGIWHFFGITLPVAINPSAWAAALGWLVVLGKEELEGTLGELSIPEVALSGSVDGCESPFGRTFTGTYPELLGELCHSLSCCTSEDVKRISIACHPPCTLQGFSTLILADDFPLKNIVIKEGGPRPPKIVTPAPAAFDPVSGPLLVQIKNFVRPWWGGVLLGLVVGLVVGITVGNSRRGSEIVRLKRENSELRMDSGNLREELSLERLENQNISPKSRQPD